MKLAPRPNPCDHGVHETNNNNTGDYFPGGGRRPTLAPPAGTHASVSKCSKNEVELEIKEYEIVTNFYNCENDSYYARLAPMWQQSGTLLFCSCHGIAGFLVDELQI